jgi:hypothetical protein
MFLWGITDERSQHFRRYTKKELTAKTQSAGLQTVRASYFNTLLFLPIAALRLFVRIFRIRINSENELGSPFINKILFQIFDFERVMLKYTNFPFGVSAMVVCRKK